MESIEQKTKPTAQQRVDAWNRSMSPGLKVTYTKSELEGRIVLKTTGAAYVFGDEAAVELEHIGTALLTKLAPFDGRPVRQRKLSMPKFHAAFLVAIFGFFGAAGVNLNHWLYGPAHGKELMDAAQARRAAEWRGETCPCGERAGNNAAGGCPEHGPGQLQIDWELVRQKAERGEIPANR